MVSWFILFLVTLGLLALFAIASLVIGLINTVSRRSKSNWAPDEFNQQLQVHWQNLERMERRIENLETILIEQQRTRPKR